jgi:glycyl-tRNA synthetase beta chain
MKINNPDSRLQTPRPRYARWGGPDSRPLLLEIGTEEIPSRFIPHALEKMVELIRKLFSENRIGFGKVSTMGTPMRLVLMVEDLAEYQRSSLREIIGPAKRVSYDESGRPTKAAYGFAKGQGISIEDLKLKVTEKGEYICALLEEKGVSVEALLPEILVKFTTSIPFPKYMRWMDKNTRFARPIRWILALYGNDIVPFEIEGIKSGNVTRGHRFMSPGAFQVKGNENYYRLLENNYVILDQEKRKKVIENQLRELSQSIGGRVFPDDDLLTEVTYLVEYPVALLGSFDKKYLNLPKEVLVNAMREHQRYFSVVNDREDLLPYFLSVSNTKAEDMNLVRLGNERVLRARLEDARFYFDEDIKKRLDERVDDLKGIIYQDRLGTIYQKIERISALSSYLARKIAPDLEGVVQRAAYLSKADLITGMVREFPKLQGVMGKKYALLSGEETEVAEAIYEHYLPRFTGDEIPKTKTGAILSIAEKMDSIAGFFSLGLIPTGSEDPYALRRQAQGIISILISCCYLISLNELITKAIEPFRQVITEKEINPNLKEDILSFFRQRLDYILNSEGHRYDTIDAVLSSNFDIPLDVNEKASALTRFRERDEFNPFLTAIKRVINILPKRLAGPEPWPDRQDRLVSGLNEELLKEDAEKRLYKVYKDAKRGYEERLEERDFSGALERLLPLRDAIDNFFDKVLVMDKHEEIRNNRLSLLKGIHELSLRIADLSKIT